MKLVAAAIAVAALAAAPAAGAAQLPVTLKSDRAQVSIELGRDFGFTTTLTNRGSEPTGTLVAHLNVLSLRPGTYVDPEDWSAQRTHYVQPIPAGASRTVGWRVKAVNGGTLAVYVVVVPQARGAAEPVTGPVLRLDVSARRTLDAGGVLPLALGVPALLLLLTLGTRFTRRRRGSLRPAAG